MVARIVPLEGGASVPSESEVGVEASVEAKENLSGEVAVTRGQRSMFVAAV